MFDTDIFFFMFDTDKHYFASKLTTDMSVYVGPTYTMYVGITLFQLTHSICPTLAQRCANTLALRRSNEQVNVGSTLFYNVGPTE